MDVQVFSTWLQNQGYKVYQTHSSYWYNAGPRVLQAFPYGWLIQPSEQELRRLLVRHGLLALRYSTPMDALEGMVSYHVVLRGPYQIEKLRSQARNGIRAGLKNCQVEKIPFTRLAEEGWILQQDTLERQNRINSMTQAEWQQICKAAEGLPSFQAWGAIVEGKPAATLLTCRIGDTCYVPYAQSLSQYLSAHVNNALFYVVSCELLAGAGVSEIFFSLHSLDAPESVNEFKFRMGLTAKPVRQRVVFHPLLKPFANPTVYRWCQQRLEANPADHITAKAEGMLRFYLQGKLSMDSQTWPNCVSEYKGAFQPPAPIQIAPNEE